MKSVRFNKNPPLGHKSEQSWRNTHISMYYGIITLICLVDGDYTSDSSGIKTATFNAHSSIPDRQNQIPLYFFSCLKSFFLLINMPCYSSKKNVECKFHVTLKAFNQGPTSSIADAQACIVFLIHMLRCQNITSFPYRKQQRLHLYFFFFSSSLAPNQETGGAWMFIEYRLTDRYWMYKETDIRAADCFIDMLFATFPRVLCFSCV